MSNHNKHSRSQFRVTIFASAKDRTRKIFHSITLGALAYGIALACLFQAQASERFCITGVECPNNEPTMAKAISPTPSRSIVDLHDLRPRPQRNSELTRCRDTPVALIGATEGEVGSVCAAARYAVAFLGKCRIPVLRPFRIQIEDEVRHQEKGEIFGMFNSDHETAFIISESQIGLLTENTPYSVIPNHEFFRSLVVHEVVHAIFHQHYRLDPSSRAVHEYPAYVLQFESISDEARARLQSAIYANAYEDIIFSDLLLAMNPYGFGALAHRHFTRSADGCEIFHQLINNEVSFILSAPNL